MALNLDTRQRAMLQEMGISVWLPQTDAVAVAEVLAGRAAPPLPERSAPVLAPMAHNPTPTPAPVQTSAAELRAAPVAAAEIPAAILADAVANEAIAWCMAPAVAAYPDASTPGGHAAPAWLVVWESPHPSHPLAGDTGKLLDNMLRALRLHLHGKVWVAALQRPGSHALPAAGLPEAPVAWQAVQPSLTECLQQLRPARIVVLGLHAARAILGGQEALGRLRAQVHHVQQTPLVVSYDPAYLLRSPHAKPAAWADWCRASSLQPSP